MAGWIKLHRDIREHWIWKSDHRLKWWLDILLSVNHCDSKVLIKGKLIDCGRGQSVISLESWAKKWNVSRKAVKDFFALLQNDSMISMESVRISTRITVCNYDSYQSEVNAQEPHKPRTSPAQEPDTLHKQEGEEGIKNDKKRKHNFDFTFLDAKFIPVFMEWIDYKKSRNENYKTQKSLEACYRNLLRLANNNPNTAKLLIDQAMGNNWAGIFPLKINGRNQDEPIKITQRTLSEDAI